MILVTGDSGFIGRHIVRHLVRRNSEVHGIDLVRRVAGGPEYPQVVGNILDRAAVLQAMKGARCVIHLAAEHKDFGITRDKYFEVNEEGTGRLLACASELNVKEFVFYSSVAVYGSQTGSDETSPPHPNNAYGESKCAGERVVTKWVQEDPTRKALIIRPTVVFGPFSHANIFKLISYVCDRKFIWVGNGENIKSIAYVENLVEATMFLMDRMKEGVELFNYSDEPQMTTRQLVSLIAEKAGVPLPKLKIPLGVALAGAKAFDTVGAVTGRDFPITTARIRKFNTSTIFKAGKLRSLGFTASHSISEALERNIKWYFEELKTGKVVQFENSRE